MNRVVRLVLIAAISATALISAGVLALTLATGGYAAEITRKDLLLLALFVWIPSGLAWDFIRTSRRFADDKLRLADDHRRHVQGAMVFWYLVALGLTGVLAYIYLTGFNPPGDTGVRALVLLVGVAMAVRGNFVPKLSPPTGVAAPEPAAWTRTMLTLGWALMLTGFAVSVSAFVLPLRPLLLALFGALVAIVAMAVFQRRRLRPRSPA